MMRGSVLWVRKSREPRPKIGVLQEIEWLVEPRVWRGYVHKKRIIQGERESSAGEKCEELGMILPGCHHCSLVHLSS